MSRRVRSALLGLGVVAGLMLGVACERCTHISFEDIPRRTYDLMGSDGEHSYDATISVTAGEVTVEVVRDDGTSGNATYERTETGAY